MSKVSAWHSKVTKDVHHDDTECKTGNNIESYNRVEGTGGLRHCEECAQIQSAH